MYLLDMTRELSRMAEKSNVALDLIWGVEAIARAIGRSERTTYDMLTRGHLPAKQVGTRWVIERSKLVAFFTGEAA